MSDSKPAEKEAPKSAPKTVKIDGQNPENTGELPDKDLEAVAGGIKIAPTGGSGTEWTWTDGG